MNSTLTLEQTEQRFPGYQNDLKQLVRLGYFKTLQNSERVRPSKTTEKFKFAMKYSAIDVCPKNNP